MIDLKEAINSADVKTRIIIVMIVIILTLLIASRPSWVNKMVFTIQNNAKNIDSLRLSLSWAMARQEELKTELKDEYGLEYNK